MKWWIWLILLSAFGGVLGAGYMYFDHTQKELGTLNQNLGKVEAENKLQDEALKTIKAATEDMKRVSEEIAARQEESQDAVVDLERKFTKITADGAQRDLGRLAEARPVSIERIVNEGTDQVFRCVELSTGTKLNEEEKKEYDETGKIRDCPGLVIPR